MATKQDRAFESINIKVYEDEDADLVEFLKGKPKTWIVKEALRFYRENFGKPIQQQGAPDLSRAKDALGGL